MGNAGIEQDAVATQLEIVDGADGLQHRPFVQYPAEARAKSIEGDVRIEIEVNGEGLVVDARYIDGPLELRRAGLRSVLDWHYGGEGVAGRRIVTLRFRLPGNDQLNGSASSGTPTQQFTLGVLSRIDIEGLSEQGKQQTYFSAINLSRPSYFRSFSSSWLGC